MVPQFASSHCTLLSGCPGIVQDPSSDVEPAWVRYFEWICAICFSLEALLKIAAFGVVLQSGAYLRVRTSRPRLRFAGELHLTDVVAQDPWNWLDGLMVLSSWYVLLANGQTGTSALRTLRLFRSFRQMRRCGVHRSLRDANTASGTLRHLRHTIQIQVSYLACTTREGRVLTRTKAWIAASLGTSRCGLCWRRSSDRF